jgi:hypothetical protein
MLRLTLALLLAALATAAGASAGGWATAGISPRVPDDPGGGTTWNTTITVLQHGRTPLDGVSPAVILRNSVTGEERRFAASPTGEPGRYAAAVTFPASGRWAVQVYDGFTEYGNATRHDFGVVELASAGASAGGGFPVAWALAGLGALAAALVATASLLLRRRGSAAPLPTSFS